MNQSKLSLNLLSIAMLLVLPNCSQTTQEITDQTEIKPDSKIKLFVYHSCRYCQKVMEMLRKSGNMDKVLIVDANIPENAKELKRLTSGNTQCPFIFDEEKNIKMHESEDIMQYFQQRFAA